MTRFRTSPSRCVAAGATALTVLLAGCGGTSDATDLSPAATDGRGIMRRSGCGSCHGSDGGGGVGPAFVDLFGTDVPLDDGTSVTADRAYLTESILEPAAKIVDGYTLPMPKTNLSNAEIDSIIAYIEALGTTGTTTG
ncbi:MAG: c-type cytochrome [Ilumatobacteraceae bacterium]